MRWKQALRRRIWKPLRSLVIVELNARRGKSGVEFIFPGVGKLFLMCY